MIVQWRKWGGSPHWRHECVYLGADEWGDWIGQPEGWRSARPGRFDIAHTDNVTLIPRPDLEFGADFALTVNRAHRKGMRIYIDLGWNIVWGSGPALEPSAALNDLIALVDGVTEPGSQLPVCVTGIDMDLDVVRVEGVRGTWVDDRDEWAEHSAMYGYPVAVMERLEGLALSLESRVRAQAAPFDNATADYWLDRLEALGAGR